MICCEWFSYSNMTCESAAPYGWLADSAYLVVPEWFSLVLVSSVSNPVTVDPVLILFVFAQGLFSVSTISEVLEVSWPACESCVIQCVPVGDLTLTNRCQTDVLSALCWWISEQAFSFCPVCKVRLMSSYEYLHILLEQVIQQPPDVWHKFVNLF